VSDDDELERLRRERDEWAAVAMRCLGLLAQAADHVDHYEAQASKWRALARDLSVDLKRFADTPELRDRLERGRRIMEYVALRTERGKTHDEALEDIAQSRGIRKKTLQNGNVDYWESFLK